MAKDRYLYEYSRNCIDCGKKITRRATRCPICCKTGKLNYGWKDGYTLKKGKCLNLISLCVNCHSKTNNNRKYWMEKLSANLIPIKSL